MFDLILFLISLGYLIYKAITYKPIPKGARIDWEAEDRDRQAGMTWEERQKKWKRNGEAYAERKRDFGGYMYIAKL